MKRYLLGIILVLSIFAIGCVEKPIGGERDEHGCLGPAGYTWDNDIGACIRTWELENENQREAAKIAVEHIGQKKGLMVVEVDVARCPGCFVVQFDTYGEQSSVSLEYWEVVE